MNKVFSDKKRFIGAILLLLLSYLAPGFAQGHLAHALEK